ncbi:hypothetical protein V2H45_15235 [Tumidithrix elongata RA019]|uniref:Uncharacterized protein n=1 Tax=Tumidithrix elongata BACA0141 TaxID=2716417 RepID=A0AAW9PUY3_9CYAN|nr:hypothetical protein [Tumidithrix elongata RA019]
MEDIPLRNCDLTVSDLDLKLNFSPNAEEYQAMVLKAKQYIHKAEAQLKVLSSR